MEQSREYQLQPVWPDEFQEMIGPTGPQGPLLATPVPPTLPMRHQEEWICFNTPDWGRRYFLKEHLAHSVRHSVEYIKRQSGLCCQFESSGDLGEAASFSWVILADDHNGGTTLGTAFGGEDAQEVPTVIEAEWHAADGSFHIEERKLD